MRGENILWSGQPDPNVNFTSMDILLVPFSLFWVGFSVFWESLVISNIPKNAPYTIYLIFTLFGLIFVLIGVYLIFGRFLFKRWKKRKTYYAVTNRRIFSLSEALGQQFQEADIKFISGMSKQVRSDGVGTLTFGGNQSSFFSGRSYYVNTGLDIFPFYATQLVFCDIRDADDVYKLIMDLKTRET